MSREIFTSNDKYILYPLSEEDRSNYLELNAQIEGNSIILRKHSDCIWESVMEDTTNFFRYMIIKKNFVELLSYKNRIQLHRG